MKKLIGPFKQILSLSGLPLFGSLTDDKLEIIEDGGVLVEDGIILAIDKYTVFDSGYSKEVVQNPMVLLPGFIDCHTHMCWGGSRAHDYARRISGASYESILSDGGGIYDTMNKTRATSPETLETALVRRVKQHLESGITTVEIKSGYGLTAEEELKLLRVIRSANELLPTDIVATCLAAHVRPPEFEHNHQYLDMIIARLLPVIKAEQLCNRVDIFVEANAFNVEDAKRYLQKASEMGFDLTVHADQFSTGGSELAVNMGAISADHLEASGDREVALLAGSNTTAVVLPGASLGLGMGFSPARKLLDAGASVAIGSDWNPGSAPMGDLLIQSAILSAFEKLNATEVFAGITFRAARALGLNDRGVLEPNMMADFCGFETSDYRDILWHQGKMKPRKVWKNGELAL